MENEYENYFDPRKYLQKMCSSITGPENEGDTFLNLVDALWEIYSQGNVKGKSLLDVGSGPNIFPLIPALPYFDEIILSDISSRNRAELHRWLAGKPDAFDFSEFFRYYAKKDGREKRWADNAKYLRQKIVHIVTCNVHNTSVLADENDILYDAVSCHLVLEVACKNKEEYIRAFGNVTGLVKPGGYLIVAGGTGESYFIVGDHRFTSCNLQDDTVSYCIEKFSLNVIHYKKFKHTAPHINSDLDGFFVLVAQKPEA